MTNEYTRRKLLAATGGLGIVALAGCIADSGAPAAGGNVSPTGPPEADHEPQTETHHDHPEHTHEAVSGPSASAEVRMISTDAGEHYDPHVVWVEEGGTITWTNESGAHSVTAYAEANDRPHRIPDAAESFDSGTLTGEGETYEVTFDQSGVYDYFCLPHETLGMIGSIIVGNPDPHDQPGLAEPQADMHETVRTKISQLNAQCNEALGHVHDEEDAAEPTDDDDHHEDDHAHESKTEDGHQEADHHETETDHHDDGHDH